MSNPRKLARRARMLRWMLNLYPPYLGAGIRVQHISPDLRSVKVAMKLTRWNRNYVGTSSVAACMPWSTRSTCCC